MNAKNKIIAELQSLDVEMTKEIITKLSSDTRSEADIVLSLALDVLMTKIPESEFLSFCEKLS